MDARAVASSDPWPTIPGYELLREIGAGGMGSVFLAKRRGQAAVCAVKVLKSELMASSTVVRRFEKEIEVLMLQQHPGIVRLLDAGRTLEGRLYLTTGFLSGHDLFRVIHRVGPMPGPAWLQLALQFLEALADAHESRREGRPLRLIHRDLKPENLMLDYEGRVTILDFGLASVRLNDERSRVTRVGQVMGTPKYMAPEQIVDPESVSPATDVFSAAVTLSVIAAGRTTGADLPNGDDKLPLGELWAKLSDPQWPALSKLAPQMPPDFDPVFQRALSTDARVRFPSARGLLTAVREAAPFPPLAPERLGLLLRGHFEQERLDMEAWLAQHVAPEPMAEATRAGPLRPKVRFTESPGTAVTELARLTKTRPRAGLVALGFGLVAALAVAGALALGPSAPEAPPRVVPAPSAQPSASAVPSPPRPPSPRTPAEVTGKAQDAPSASRRPVRRPPPAPATTPPSPSRKRPPPDEPPTLEAEREARRAQVWRQFDALQVQDLEPGDRAVKALELLREVAPLDPDDPCGRRALYASRMDDYVRRCRPD